MQARTEKVEKQIDAMTTQGLWRERHMRGAQNVPEMLWDRKPVVNFSSNDYLGLSQHPVLKRAAFEAIDRYGVGTGASRLVTGSLSLHQDLEDAVCCWKSAKAALVLNSGYSANAGIIPCLVSKGDVVLSDKLCHASIVDGCRLSGALYRRFRHNDVDHLKYLLRGYAHHRNVLVVTESLFSMDGDRAPLDAILAVVKSFRAMLMVDEAHATGLYGCRGAGLIQAMSLESEVDIQLGTFGKALGSFGAYVVASSKLTDYLWNRCRSLIYSTSLPPSVIAANIAAINLVPLMSEARVQLQKRGEQLRLDLHHMGLSTGPSCSQIVPIILKTASRAKQWSDALLDRGVHVAAIRPPTVPRDGARLRVTLSATHTQEHLRKLTRAIRDICQSEHSFWPRPHHAENNF